MTSFAATASSRSNIYSSSLRRSTNHLHSTKSKKRSLVHEVNEEATYLHWTYLPTYSSPARPIQDFELQEIGTNCFQMKKVRSEINWTSFAMLISLSNHLIFLKIEQKISKRQHHHSSSTAAPRPLTLSTPPMGSLYFEGDFLKHV